MTAAPTPEALREALADVIRTHVHLRYEGIMGEDSTVEGFDEAADDLITGPLANFTAQLAQLTQERDEAICRVSEHAMAQGEAEGALRGYLAQPVGQIIADRDAARAECDALKGEVERLRSLLLPIQDYAKVALRPEIDFGDGEIGEMIHDGLRHSLRTQDLRAIRDADLSRAALAQEARDDG